MYAIIKTGGNKQYRVKLGDVISIDLLDLEAGAQIEFGEVLFADDGSKTHVGQPGIADYFVYGEVVGQVSGEKITSLKYKPSHNQCRKWGHRQKFTEVKITGIGTKRHSNKEHHHGT